MRVGLQSNRIVMSINGIMENVELMSRITFTSSQYNQIAILYKIDQGFNTFDNSNVPPEVNKRSWITTTIGSTSCNNAISLVPKDNILFR